MSMLALDDQYNPIYAGLTEVREIFHRDGRLSDSNQKLDETLKLLSIHFAATKGLLDHAAYQACLNAKTFRVAALQKLFQITQSLPLFRTNEGESLFEHAPKLAFSDDENELAFELFRTLSFSGIGNDRTSDGVDFLNEAFGHFVRDNFRSNTEDAQYMTPPEVVAFMVSMAADLLPKKTNEPLVVMDPSSGVGSFLTSFGRVHQNQPRAIKYVAQDKVERMARLTAANFIFSDTTDFEIHIGNSLYQGSPIDRWNNKVDVILTNPPFGAKFSAADIAAKCGDNTPAYKSARMLPASIDSELLFVDRYLSLLRPGGICLVVVPDGVISAKGPAAFARSALLHKADVLAIIELPAVTFAQAGTRTKTSILVFQKHLETKTARPIFVGEAKGVGFDVIKRKGVAVKKIEGENNLPEILKIWRRESTKAQSEKMATWVDVNLADKEAWTPRSLMFQSNSQKMGSLQEIVRLRELVKPIKKRKMRAFSNGCYFISVLHVTGEGFLDIPALKTYAPVTPGVAIEPGNVLVSRINPRIPRVLVVPELPGDIICSSEFEILEPADGVSPYRLAYSLLTPFAQEQLQSLTAGTSASHARIKPGKMLDVSLPWPTTKKFSDEMQDHEADLRNIFESMWKIVARRERMDS